MILDEEDYIKFLRKIDEGLKEPTSLVPTPRIENARKLIKEYCIMKNFLEKIENADKETLECIYDVVLTIFINQEINKIDFDCVLDKAEIKIINSVSKIFSEMDMDEENIIPTVDTELDYENNTVAVHLTFRDGATTCIGPKKIGVLDD
jgi:hypothetical protein